MAPDLTREEASRLLSGDFGRALRDTVASFVAPLVWEVLDDQGEVLLRNGTAFFLDAGEGPFLVTADHVFQGYLDAKQACPSSYCQLWNMRFDPTDRLIDRCSDRERYPDIATFRITQDEIQRLGKVAITGSQQTWPPGPPQEDRGVFYAGFPGGDRIAMTPRDLSFNCFVGLLVASSVSERDILCYVQEEHLIDPPHPAAAAPPDYDVRGISGAPLLTHVERSGLTLWQLAGVIYKGAGGMIFASRADYILPDGRLKAFG